MRQIIQTLLVVALGIAIVVTLQTTLGREAAMILGAVIGLGGSLLIAWVTKQRSDNE